MITRIAARATLRCMKQRTLLLLSFLLVCAPSLFAQRRPSSPPAPLPSPARSGDPLAGLTVTQGAAFIAGRIEFVTAETIDDGLGPVFNERSCVACHTAPAVGGASPRTVRRFGTMTNGMFDSLTQLGGSLVQDHAIGPREGSVHPFRPEIVPPAPTIVP